MFMNVPIRSDSFRSVSKFFLFVCRSDHSPRLSFQSSLRAASSKTTSQLYRALRRMVPGSVKRVLWQITKKHKISHSYIKTHHNMLRQNTKQRCIMLHWTAFVISTTYVMTKITCIPYRHWFTGQHIALHCNTVHCCPFQSNALHLQCTTWKIKRVHI